MTGETHPLAPHQTPFFVPALGQTDWLLVTMGIFLLLAVIGIGVLYFKLHALPEHMAHRGQKVQFEIVAVLDRPNPVLAQKRRSVRTGMTGLALSPCFCCASERFTSARSRAASGSV